MVKTSKRSSCCLCLPKMRSEDLCGDPRFAGKVPKKVPRQVTEGLELGKLVLCPSAPIGQGGVFYEPGLVTLSDQGSTR